MKLKYYNVLQENEKQKLSIQDYIQKEIDANTKLKKLNDEKQTQVDDMYKLRMDLTKKVNENKNQEQTINEVKDQNDQLVKVVEQLSERDK